VKPSKLLAQRENAVLANTQAKLVSASHTSKRKPGWYYEDHTDGGMPDEKPEEQTKSPTSPPADEAFEGMGGKAKADSEQEEMRSLGGTESDDEAYIVSSSSISDMSDLEITNTEVSVGFT
jgi:hypothetical protein